MYDWDSAAGAAPSVFNPTGNFLQMGGYGAPPPADMPMPLKMPGSGFDFSGAKAPFAPSFMQGMTGYTDPTSGMSVDGWGGMTLRAAQGMANLFMGMKQYGLYKDQLAESKRQFGLNYDAQKSTTNSAMEDRQRARVASNAGAYQSVGDYMNKNQIR